MPHRHVTYRLRWRALLKPRCCAPIRVASSPLSRSGHILRPLWNVSMGRKMMVGTCSIMIVSLAMEGLQTTTAMIMRARLLGIIWHGRDRDNYARFEKRARGHWLWELSEFKMEIVQVSISVRLCGLKMFVRKEKWVEEFHLMNPGWRWFLFFNILFVISRFSEMRIWECEGRNSSRVSLEICRNFTWDLWFDAPHWIWYHF
jgi:hypothetical protein